MKNTQRVKYDLWRSEGSPNRTHWTPSLISGSPPCAGNAGHIICLANQEVKVFVPTDEPINGLLKLIEVNSLLD